MEGKPSKQSEGGKARAEKLTPEQGKAIAANAAAARWGTRPIQATHKGTFEADFGIDVECYVLDDGEKTAVLSQRGMGRALGFVSQGGNAFARFLSTKAMESVIGSELRQKLAQPLKFQWGKSGSDGEEKKPIFGYDAALLIDLCRAIVNASGSKNLDGSRAVEQAHVILNASAKAGIKGLVYALAGYNPTAAEVIEAFKAYVQEEARKYEKEFPPELYNHWYRLFEIPPIVGRGRPWQFKYLTVNHIYYPLAKSNGKILDLMRAMKAKGGVRKKKLFQFLNEIGARALSRQMGRVLEMAEDSPDKDAYVRKTLERFGGQPELDFGPQ